MPSVLTAQLEAMKTDKDQKAEATSAAAAAELKVTARVARYVLTNLGLDGSTAPGFQLK